MHDSPPVIQVEALTKTYQVYARPQDRLKQILLGRWRQYGHAFHALNQIEFSIYAGETVGIIGRNGSGKSTLLKLICGTLEPTQGQVHVNGKVAALLELGTGFHPEFTGRDNVRMNATLHGLAPATLDARMDSILAFADIGDFIDQPVKTYSSGMQVRLAFAVIAHVDADILVIDEALAVGDAFFVQKCMRFLRDFQQRGTLLFVSHDTAAVINLCERAIWLDNGQQRAIGPAKAICEAYLVARWKKRDGWKAETVDTRPNDATGPTPTEGLDCATLSAQPMATADQRLAWEPRPQQLAWTLPPCTSSTAGHQSSPTVVLHEIYFLSAQQTRMLWFVGHEWVTLILRLQCLQGLAHPVVSFFIKDRLGQHLFGDTTYFSTLRQAVPVATGEDLRIQFQFQMPVLPAGDYLVDVVVTEQQADVWVQRAWFFEALHFNSHANSTHRGLIGIPMTSVTLNTQTLQEINT